MNKENQFWKLYLDGFKDLYQHLVETGGGGEQEGEMTHGEHFIQAIKESLHFYD